MRPCEQPVGHMLVAAKEAKKKVTEDNRAVAKAQRPVEKYGELYHQLKKVRVVVIQVHVEKIVVDTFRVRYSCCM